MFGKKSVRLTESLHSRLASAAAAQGYSSAEEFVAHVLEKALGELGPAGPVEMKLDEEVARQLRGLGYLE